MTEKAKLPGTPFCWGTGAMRFGAVFLGLFSVVVVFAIVDHARTARLEQFEEVSAVGDTVYFQRATSRQGAVVATLNGQPLYPVTDQKKELKDTNMVRVAHDQTTGLNIYTPRKARSSEPRKKEQTLYFLKLGRNDYFEVRPRSAEK
jgi:hypothetical protein